VPGSNGRRELLFLVGDEPEEFTLHAIVDLPGERSLNFPETEGPRNGPARSPPVRSPVDTVQAGIRSGRTDPELLPLLPSRTSPAFPGIPAVDLGHGFPTFPPPLKAKGTQRLVRTLRIAAHCNGSSVGVQEIRDIPLPDPEKGN